MNMFLAIISDTYSEVKADLSVSERRFPVSDYIDSLKSDVYKELGSIFVFIKFWYKN